MRRWPTAWIYHPSDRFQSGIPDLLICVPPHGAFLAIEVKRPGLSADPIQAVILTRIRRAGGRAWVCYSAKEISHVELP